MKIIVKKQVLKKDISRYRLMFQGKERGSVTFNKSLICSLHVDKNYRRKGISRKLMSTLIKDNKGKYMTLLVDGEDISNSILLKFYRSLGFISWKHCPLAMRMNEEK